MKVLIVDNYDSFVYNLYHYIGQFSDDVQVKRVDACTWEDMDACDAIVLSPGPGLPPDMPNLIEIVKRYGSIKKILGVCLGHQAIAMAYGARLKNLNQVLHGLSKPSVFVQDERNIFRDLPIKLECARYHSWVVEKDSLPEELLPTAFDEEGHVMALRHAEYDIHGVQFHPESVMTEQGMRMIENWIKM